MPKQMSNRQPPPNITSITYWRKFAVHRVFYIGLAALFGLSAIAYFGSPRGMNGPSGTTERGNEAVVVVNGEKVTRAEYQTAWNQKRQQAQMMVRYTGQPMTEMMAVQDQGRILQDFVDNAIRKSAAKKRGLSVSDAAVDQELAKFRQPDDPKDPKAKPLTDEELDKRFQETAGLTLPEVRERLRDDLLPRILEDSIADKEKVTEDDLLKSYDEAKVRRILFPISSGPHALPGALPDASAKLKAEKALAKVKGGADFAKTADELSGDPANQQTVPDPKTKKSTLKKNGGLMNADMGGWYKRGDNRDKAFDEAVFKLKKGEISEVVKTDEGYQILKVDDTRRQLPEEYAKHKADLLKAEKRKRADKPIQDLIDAEKKAAKIEWKDPSLEWRYQYAKLPMMGMSANPVPGEREKAEEAFLANLRAYTAKTKDDYAAFLVLGHILDNKMMMATMRPQTSPAPDRNKLREEAISAYETALKKTEDRQTRFRLVTLYQEAGRKDEALKHAETLMRHMSFDNDPKHRFEYQQLVGSFQSLGRPELAAKALARFQELTKKEQDEQKKMQAAQKAAMEKAAAEKKPAGNSGNKGGVNIIPGGSINVTPGGTPPGPKAEVKADDKKPAADDKKPGSAAGDKKPAANDQKPEAGKR